MTYKALRGRQNKCHRVVVQMRNELSTNEEEKTGRVKESFWGGRRHALGKHGKLGWKEILPIGTDLVYYALQYFRN